MTISSPISSHRTSTPTDRTEASPRRPRKVMRAVGVLLAAATLCLATQAAPAGASTTIANVTFMDSTALCGNGGLHIWVGDNTFYGASAPARWAQIKYYDYSTGLWYATPWQSLNSFGFMWNITGFRHHGYYYPVVQYAVQTSTGIRYATQTFPYFSQYDSTGYNTYLSRYCWI